MQTLFSHQSQILKIVAYKAIITRFERLFFCEQFPEQNCKAVDVVFNSSWVVDVDPDFRWCMCHSACTITTTVGIRLWIGLVFPFSQSEVTHLWQTYVYIHGVQKKKTFLLIYLLTYTHLNKLWHVDACSRRRHMRWVKTVSDWVMGLH